MIYIQFILLSETNFEVFGYSANQIGSRFIQQNLETASPEEKNMIFMEIYPQALILMTYVFGNYVLPKLCHACLHTSQ